MNDTITRIEYALAKEFKKNYLVCMSQLIALNIVTIYNYYGNDYETSLNSIIKTSTDNLILSDKDIKKLKTIIKDSLEGAYRIKIMSNDEANLILKEI